MTFRLQIIQTVSQIENIYWDLVNAYANVTVQQRALDLANKTLSDNQKQVAAGTLAPLTVVQSQSAVATAQQNLITAQVNLQLQQLLMKNAVTRNMADPMLAVAPVIPTDTLNITEQYQMRPVEELIDEALQQRPEIATARLTLTNNEISRKSIRNQLLPTVDLYSRSTAPPLWRDRKTHMCTNRIAAARRREPSPRPATATPSKTCSTARRPTKEWASTSISRCATARSRPTRCARCWNIARRR